MEAAWCKAETESADEHVMKNICQYQPFIARGERAELFNSFAFPPSLFPHRSETECVFIWAPKMSLPLKFAAVFGVFVTPFSHMIQTYKPPVEFQLIGVIDDDVSKVKISLCIFFCFCCTDCEWEEPLWLQLYGSCITALTTTTAQKKKNMRNKSLRRRRTLPTIRHIVPLFSVYANETSRHVGKLATCQPDPNK